MDIRWSKVIVVSLVAAIVGACASTACAQQPDPVRVSIELPKERYTIGDPFSFTLRSTRDCHFIVFTIDASDRVELHDPGHQSAFMGPPVLRAGERRTVPVSDAPGRAVITPPAGSYEIGAVCGRDELAQYGLDRASMIAPAESGRRGFKFFLEKATGALDREALSLITVSFTIDP